MSKSIIFIYFYLLTMSDENGIDNETNTKSEMENSHPPSLSMNMIQYFIDFSR
jgi:hypothetical protein